MFTLSKQSNISSSLIHVEKMLMDMPKCNCPVCSHTKEFARAELGESRFKALWNKKIEKDF